MWTGASFGAALLYFTGSKAHNIALRKIAIKSRWKLNEYGLFRGRRSIAGDFDLIKRLKRQLPPFAPVGFNVGGAEVNVLILGHAES